MAIALLSFNFAMAQTTKQTQSQATDMRTRLLKPMTIIKVGQRRVDMPLFLEHNADAPRASASMFLPGWL